MKKINKLLGLTTVRKKVFFLSKLTGLILILFYILTEEFLIQTDFNFIIWLIFMLALILGVDVLLGKFISTPLDKLNKSSKEMAELNLDIVCKIQTGDEFEELAENLNKMSSKLKATLIELEVANRKLEEDVVNKEKLLLERRELVDNLSHEMKTPLGVIRAYSEGLKEETDKEKQKQYINVISSSVDKMNDLIITLLDLSALETGAVILSKETFDFIDLAETVAGRLLIDTPNKNFEFSYDLPNDKILISADKSRIEQVLNNLIINAKNNVLDNGKIHLSIILKNDKVLFEIYNDSNSIIKEDLSKLWMKFYRSKDAKKGSGLGLSIVSEILSLYGCDYGANLKDYGVLLYFCFDTINII